MDNLTKKQRTKNMKRIKSQNTKPEILLRKTLWNKGFRYRKNCKNIFGKPDLVFLKQKIAIFIDGEFWHGYNWEKNRERIGTNREYWIKKIERNISRDKEVDEKLRENGWIILRFWAKDILKNNEQCAEKIIKNIYETKIFPKKMKYDKI